MRKYGLIVPILLGYMTMFACGAWATVDPQPSEASMANHGFSDETIRLMTLQKDRMEGSEAPQPSLNRTGRFFHNFFFSHWGDSLDEFGYNKIRESE